MESNRGTVDVHFPDGSSITTWTSFTLTDSFVDPIGHLELEVKVPKDQVADYRAKLAKGQIVTLLVNNASQGGFLINEVTRRYSASDGVVFKLVCKTPLVTPYEGSVDPELTAKYPTDASVLTIIQQALAPYGFTTVGGDPNSHLSSILGKPLDAAVAALNVDAFKHKECTAHEGETAYQFCSRIFTRLGAALRMNADGTLLLTAPDYTQPAAYAVVQGTGDGDYFVGDVEVHDTNAGQFSQAIVRGARYDDPGVTQTSRPIANVQSALLFANHPPYSSTPANYKPKIVLDKHARDVAHCTSVAKGILGSRAARAYVVTGTVDGLVSKTGRIWSVGTMAHVSVDLEGLDEDMFLLGRTLRGSPNGGQSTQLRFIPVGALVLGDVPSGS